MSMLRRFIFAAVVTASAILCLAFAGLTVRSFFVEDFYRNTWGDDLHIVYRTTSSRGGFQFYHASNRGYLACAFSGFIPPQVRVPAHGDFGIMDQEAELDSIVNTPEYATTKPERYPYLQMSLTPKPLMHHFKLLGFQWASAYEEWSDWHSPTTAWFWGAGHKRVFSVTFPLAVPAVLFGILPFTLLRAKLIRGRRRKQGHCIFCGYDLRATPNICPECGRLSRADSLVSPNREAYESAPR
jgi:hypothetical protein